LLIILFRSKLTDEAGENYQAMNAELESLVRKNPGFIDVKSFKAEDGERLTVVWWRDEASLQQWRELVRHRFAQETGRRKWYEYYKMEVAEVIRQSNFERKKRWRESDGVCAGVCGSLSSKSAKGGAAPSIRTGGSKCRRKRRSEA
jgi:heme-degrading monooxygenase HmoA